MAIQPNDMLEPTFLTGAVNKRPDIEHIRSRYIWDKFFKVKNSPAGKITWDLYKSHNNLAGIYAENGRVVPINDDSFSTEYAKLVTIKQGRNVDPMVIAKIRDAGMTAVFKEGQSSHIIAGMKENIVSHISDRLMKADNEVEATLEYLAIGAMRGSIVWPPLDKNGGTITPPMKHWNSDGGSFTLTMARYPDFEQAASTLAYDGINGTQIAWNANGANPVRDIELILHQMDDQEGLDTSNVTMILTRGTLQEMISNNGDALLNWFVGSSTVDTLDTGATVLPHAGKLGGVDGLKNLLTTRLGINVLVYNASWTYTDDSNPNQEATRYRVPYLPKGEVLFVPNTVSGVMWFGLHEDANENWVFGKSAEVRKDPNTKIREITVEVTAFPVFEQGQEIYKLNAFS